MPFSKTARWKEFKRKVNQEKLSQKSINQNLVSYIEFLEKENAQLIAVVKEQQKQCEGLYSMIVALRDGTDQAFKVLTDFLNEKVLPKIDISKEEESKTEESETAK